MNKWKNMVFFLISLSLAGCATPYQKAGIFKDGGYKDQQLQADEFQVSFAGNGELSQAKAREYALRRAAEITIEKGFDCFVVTNEESATKNLVYGSANNGSGFVAGESQPEAVIMIKCSKGVKPEGVSGAYDARELLKYVHEA